MTPEQLPNELFDLIGSKKFDQLSVQERELVLKHISEEKYEGFFISLNNFQAADDDIHISRPDVKSILAKKGVENSEPSGLLKILLRPVPLYSALAALIVGIILTIFVVGGSTSSDQPNTPSDFHFADSENSGQPLKEDNYPKELVFNL